MKRGFRYLEGQYKSGALKKASYIRRMYGLHSILWDYLEFIRDKNVDSIDITKERVILTTATGIKLVCDSGDERAIPIEILNFGDYEARELEMIRKFIKKNSMILDIGANLGWYSLNLSRVAPQGRIIAFEPAPRTFALLQENLKLNGVRNVATYNFGLSDKAGEFPLYYDPKLTGATSLKKLHNRKGITKVKCKLKRLDDIIGKTPKTHVDFIKCDVEGAEKFVVLGGLRTISRNLPIIFLEMLRKWTAKFHYHPNEIIKILRSIGYKCYFAKDNKLKEIKVMNKNTAATNFYFLHPVKHSTFIKKLAKR